MGNQPENDSAMETLADLIVNSYQEAAQINRRAYIQGGAGAPGNTKRLKLWEEFGYPRDITFEHFYKAYDRNAVAFGAVHKLLEGSWYDNPFIVDGDEANASKEQSAWEKKVNKMMRKHWAKIKDADRRNLVGHYSAIILQFRDSKTWDQPVNTGALRSQKDLGLVRMIPVWESQISPVDYDNDQASENYGMPKMYSYTERPLDNQMHGPTRAVQIHPDRVIILCEGSEDETILSGIPLLKAGYNKLLDLEKISGGSAEGFLKNASRQLAINMTGEANLQALAQQAAAAGYKDLGDALNQKMQKLNRGVDDALITQAGEASVLSVAAADPEPSWTVAANEFAASIMCPFTILYGQQTGRLASDEDKEDWGKRLNGRREGFISKIVREVVLRLANFSIIDKPTKGEIYIQWTDLLAPSYADKIANAKDLAQIAKDTQAAFATSAIEINEIREAVDLEPIPDAENDEQQTTDGTQRDPLTDDEDIGQSDRASQQD